MIRPLVLLIIAFVVTGQSRAQRIYEHGSDVVLEDTQGHAISLGPGFNPVPISDHRFLIIRGGLMGYGDIGCDRPDAKNRVVIYDAETKKESVLFDKPIPLPFESHVLICVYDHADISPSGKILYVTIPCYATANCLAIIDLPTGRIKYVAGAMDVFVIRGGADAGDLIYMQRQVTRPVGGEPGYPYYPYVHARPDGTQIAVISEEDLVLNGGNAPAPILRAWLRSIHGRIFANGEWVP